MKIFIAILTITYKYYIISNFDLVFFYGNIAKIKFMNI